MDLYQTVVELIDLRSFSNLWYWISLAVLWSTASHWVLGIPYDMIQRARRSGGQTARDVEDLARININRIRYINEVAGLWLTALIPGILVTIAILGFWYDVEFAQAVFFLAFPMSFVGLITIRTALRVTREALHGDKLFAALIRHRLFVQMIGVVAIFLTALWGMYQNMSIGVLGG